MTINQELAGEVALVTGVTGGIGRAAARLLIERGAKVILSGRKSEPLRLLQQELGAAGIMVVDFESTAALESAIDDVVSGCGPLTMLANVAGIFPAAMVSDMTDDYVQRMLDVNLIGAVRLTKVVARHMRDTGRGAIVQVSSLASAKPVAGLAMYAASKAGLDAFSKALAHELAPAVRVNIVAPGPTRTEAVETMLQSDSTGAAAEVTREIPLKRLAEPEEIAEAIVFLLSDRASFITGAVLHANGGSYMA